MMGFYVTLTLSIIVAWSSIITNAKAYSKLGGIKDVTSKDRNAPFDGKRYMDLLEKIQALEKKVTDDENVVEDLEKQLGNTSSKVSENSRSISTIEDQINGVLESVNVDENYWNSTDGCGGSVVAQTGQITIPSTYRLTRPSSDTSSISSVCVWTVRANYRSRIKLSGTSISLGTYVTEFIINDDGTHSSKTTMIGSSKNYVFNGPLILITGHITSVGSVILFEGFGNLVHQDVDFQDNFYTGTAGHFSSSVNSSTSAGDKRFTKIFSTISVNTGRSILAELAIHYNQNCLNSSVQYHQNQNINTYSLGESVATGVSGVVNSKCCSVSQCPTQRYYTLDNWFTVSYSSSVLPSGNFTMMWTSKSNKTNSEQCGDILMGKSGSIAYKRSINYLNNERCVWVIYPFPKSTVRISQVISGMESTYDHLVVTEVDDSELTNYELAAPPLFRRSGDFTGRFIIVTFYTDSSIFRRGFELHWEAIGSSDTTRNLDSEFISEVSLKDKQSLTLPLSSRSKWSSGFQLYIITGSENGGIEANFTASSVGSRSSGNCNNNSTTQIYSSMSGHIVGNGTTILHNPCRSSDSRSVSVRSNDGIIYVLYKESTENVSVNLQATWDYLPVEESQVNEESRCGGLVHGSSGKINYKLDDLYDNGERCIWVLHIPTSSRIELSLLKDGFESCCDYIMVNTIIPANGSLSGDTSVLTRGNNTMTFDGPVLIITFRSDGSVNGRGFSLKFTGVGTRKEQEYQYRIVHRDEPTGNFEFPNQNDLMNEVESTYLGDKEIFILAYSSPTEPGDYAYGVNFNATIDDVLLHTNSDCDSDQLNFYINPSREGFVLSEHYPKENCLKASDGVCFNCTMSQHAINDTHVNSFGSVNRAFVAVYKPVEASVLQNFHVEWDTSAGCGGVFSDGFGRISYKVGGRYKNSEQCIWTVYSESVKEYKFTLGRNGFETCCDYIILNSLNPENGTLGPSVLLKTSSAVAVVKGPVVFVTFKSDSSVTGEGFSLMFSAVGSTSNPSITTVGTFLSQLNSTDGVNGTSLIEVEESENTTLPTYNYMHYHSRRRNSSFSYPRTHGFPSLGPNEILTFVFTPEPGRLESFDHLGSQVSITDLHLKLGEGCLSDSVRIYERNVSEMIPAREFTVEKSSPDELACNETTSAAWTCEYCPALLSRSQQLVFKTERVGFIVIFKSVSQKDPEHPFSISWNDAVTA